MITLKELEKKLPAGFEKFSATDKQKEAAKLLDAHGMPSDMPITFELGDEKGAVMRERYGFPSQENDTLDLSTETSSIELLAPQRTTYTPSSLPSLDDQAAMPTTSNVIESAFTIGKLYWDFVKDNQPITNVSNTSTSVLNPDFSNPMDYENAVLASKKLTFKG